MNTILNKRNRNEKEEIIIEKGKEKINKYIDAKFKRLNDIRLKEEKIKSWRLREDIEIEKEKEIIRFEEEIKLINLRNELRTISGYYEELIKKEKIISLMEEPEGENKDNGDVHQKKSSKRRKIEDRNYKRISLSNEWIKIITICSCWPLK